MQQEKFNLKTLCWMHFALISAKMQLTLTLCMTSDEIETQFTQSGSDGEHYCNYTTQVRQPTMPSVDKPAMQYAWVLVGGAFKTWIKAHTHTCLWILRSHQREQLANFLLRLNQSDSLALEIHHNIYLLGRAASWSAAQATFSGARDVLNASPRAETTKLASQ